MKTQTATRILPPALYSFTRHWDTASAIERTAWIASTYGAQAALAVCIALCPRTWRR